VISVLIPSRGRPEALSRSVDSLLENARDPGNIEILARIDEEDDCLLGYTDPRIKILIGPEWLGYCSMDRFWNELAAASRGKWLMCFNDDALMETKGWDTVLSHYDPKQLPCLVPKDNSTTNGWPAFPIFPRRMFEILGHITLFPGLDTWVKYVWASGPLPVYRIPVVINHLREQMNDDTMDASKSVGKFLSLDFDEVRKDYWRDLIAKDARKLCESL
jgi:hypothetical protein